MIWSALRRLIQRYGFFKREPEASVRWGQTVSPCASGLTNADAQFAADWQWQDGEFYTEHRRKNERLADIARERAWLYENKADLIAKKKGFYVRLRALKNAEMAVEQGKPEPGK